MTGILTSLHGRLVGLNSAQKLVVPAGIVSGDRGNQFYHASPSMVVQFDDFLGDVVADQWNYTEGTDTTTADGAITAAIEGAFLLTSGDSTGSVAADGAQLNSELNWKASQGLLTFQTRIQLASIAAVSVFVGFTDTKSLEGPIHASGTANGLTSNATDAVGWMFDTSMSDDDWWLVGVASDADATAQLVTTPAGVAIAPVAATYETLRIELDTSGNAVFFRNGVQVGTKMSSAVRPTIALTPVFLIWPRTTASKTMTIDYCMVAASRSAP